MSRKNGTVLHATRTLGVRKP